MTLSEEVALLQGEYEERRRALDEEKIVRKWKRALFPGPSHPEFEIRPDGALGFGPGPDDFIQLTSPILRILRPNYGDVLEIHTREGRYILRWIPGYFLGSATLTLEQKW